MKKRISALFLSLALLCALALPASAYGTGKVGENNIVSAGNYHTGFIDQSGSLWVWGENNGKLGNGSTMDSTFPVKVLDNVAAVSCGGLHTAAIKTDSSLWMWGRNAGGQLGNGGDGNATDVDGYPIQTVPVKVLDNVAAVNCGRSHTAAVKTDGSLWMWGSNAVGQLGNGGGGNATYEGNGDGIFYQTVPVKVLDGVAAVSCGDWHTAAVKTDGSLWMWGHNNCGQLGNGGGGNATDDNGYPIQSVPVKVLDNVAAVSCGDLHTAAIKTDGSLWMWGYNTGGQLGNGSITNATTPVKVLDDVAAVSCGWWHTAAVKTDGSLWSWGSNHLGQLGNGSTTDCTTPVKLLDNVAAVSGGYGHTAAVRTDGSLWTWGYNKYGQLGYEGGNSTDSLWRDPIQTVPRQVTGLTAKVPAASIAYASTQTVTVDNIPVAFQMYALKDANGNPTNYIKLRDLAYVLSGTDARFEVGWNGAVNIETKKPYTANGSEMKTPFSGDRAYKDSASPTNVNGIPVDLDAIILTDDQGGAYTYYKLRDLGDAIGFTVDWSPEKGIYIETK